MTAPSQTKPFTIERGVPCPAPTFGRPPVYPFGEMAVGDSFLFNGEIRRLRPAAAVYGKRNGCRFATRKEANGYRVWRVA